MWRIANPTDYNSIVSMSLALSEEDHGPNPIDDEQVRRTLTTLQAEPWRGRALVLELDGRIAGYTLLVSYWSNEFGGEVCHIDEIYLRRDIRGRGLGSVLVKDLVRGSDLWPGHPVRIGLEVRPGNHRARAFYERLGFSGRNRVMHCKLGD
jgi:ribosomal protein S18 acetylase RimI-like enzyme